MSNKFGHDVFLSPFTWRYGSREMREIFAEKRFRAYMRRLWVALAEAQSTYGLVTKEEVEGIRSKMGVENIDIEKALEIERKTRHSLVAELRVFADQVPKGRGKIHLGATTADIEDNADILRIREALEIIHVRLLSCLKQISEIISKHKGLVCLGWTHLQPAEPTTVGYRMAVYAQDLVMDIESLEHLLSVLKGKGFKGAVGTSASYKRLLEGKGSPRELESKITESIGLDVFPVTTQVYPRKIDYMVLSLLASITSSAHKFAFDLRLMQSPVFGEMSEPIGEEQVGSSTMPYKRNPVLSERACSLARYVASLVPVAHGNASNSLLERTLDDSAARKIIIPEAFLAVDECLLIYQKILSDLRIYPEAMKRNLERFGTFSATEALLMKLVEKGGDRQDMHERLRKISFKAWEEAARGRKNPIVDLIKTDPEIKAKLKPKEIDALLDPLEHVGDAVDRCESFLREVIRPILRRHSGKVEAGRGPEF